MRRQICSVIVGLCVSVLTLVGSAQAGTITLTTSNLGVPPSGPFALVSYALINGTTAQFSYTGLNANGNQYLIGAQGAFGLNFAAGTGALSFFSNGVGQLGGFTVPSYSLGGAANEDGFGSFNYTVDAFDGFTHGVVTSTFTVTRSTGTWANEAAILALNSNGAAAAAHIFVCPNPCSINSSASVTGYAVGTFDGNPTPRNIDPVPEPGSMILLGSGLIAVATVARKRMRRG